MKYKKRLPELVLGMMVAAIMTVPVMAGNINSGSPQCHLGIIASA